MNAPEPAIGGGAMGFRAAQGEIFPGARRQSVRTANPIETTFAAIRHRTRQSRGCLTRDGMPHMIFKLGTCAEGRWKRLRGFRCLAQVIPRVRFVDGTEVIKAAERVNEPERIAA